MVIENTDTAESLAQAGEEPVMLLLIELYLRTNRPPWIVSGRCSAPNTADE